MYTTSHGALTLAAVGSIENGTLDTATALRGFSRLGFFVGIGLLAIDANFSANIFARAVAWSNAAALWETDDEAESCPVSEASLGAIPFACGRGTCPACTRPAHIPCVPASTPNAGATTSCHYLRNQL
jgi:hypothetical protein